MGTSTCTRMSTPENNIFIHISNSSQLIYLFFCFFLHEVWDSVLYRPYCFDMTDNLYTLLQHVMWRTCKADVEDQVLIHNSCKTTFSSHVNVHQDSPFLLYSSLCIDELCIFQWAWSQSKMGWFSRV